MIGPWTQVSVQSVYRNAWIHLEHHEVLRPDGKKGVYGVVHFVHHALGVVALDETGWIWLVGQHRYPLDIYSWEIPEGGGSPDETHLQGIQRELREEAGIEATQWVDLGALHTSNSVCNETGRVFMARGITQGTAHPDGDEQIQIKKIRFAEALAMAADARITDCISIVALFRVREWLQRNDPQFLARILKDEA
jgi:8-oxo-dGTP pyrophosphatase MutT (NUDIX family)